MYGTRLTGLFALTLLTACGGSKTATVATATTHEVSAAPVSAERVAGRNWSQHAGQLKPQIMPTQVWALRQIFTSSDWTYLSIELPETSQSALQLHIDELLRAELIGHAGADLAIWTQRDNKRELLMRVRGAWSPSKGQRLQLHGRASSSDVGTPGLVLPASLIGIETAVKQPELEKRFSLALAASFAHQPSAFSSFAAARLTRLHASKTTPRSSESSRSLSKATNDAELNELMGLYTGRTAVQDSLQTRRGLLSARKPAPLSIALNKLSAIEHRPRDYNALLRAAPGSPRTGLSPLASKLPADALVFEFSSAADLAALPKEIDAKFGPLLRAGEDTPASDDMLERYRKQLALEVDGLAETFGHLAVKSAALVLSDPYLREGTDVSILFDPANASLLRTVLEKHLAKRSAEVGAVRTSTVIIAGKPATLHESSNGEVRRYELDLGGVIALSNSRAGAERLLAVSAGKLAKLSDAEDYRYARALSPHDAKSERAFAFFGDAFVERLNGPRWRIFEARRVRAESELASVNYAALLYGWVTGRAASTQQELLKSGLLRKEDLRHADGAAISWSPELGASSSWGRVGQLTPIADMPDSLVGKDEQQAYAAFRTDYRTITEGRIDPTSLRIVRSATDGVWDSELRVLPLSVGGEYGRDAGMLNRLIRGGTMLPGEVTSPVAFALALGEQSPLRDLGKSSSRMLGGLADGAFDVIGRWVQVGTDDDSLWWEWALDKGRDVLTIRDESAERPHVSLDRDLQRVPAWVMIEVKNKLALKTMLTALKQKVVSEEERDSVRWEKDAPYKGEDVQKITVRDDDAVGNIFYATAKDVLVVAFRRDVLEARIDDAIGHRTPNAGNEKTNTVSQTLDLAPLLGSSLRRLGYAMWDKSAMRSHERSCMHLEALARGLGTSLSSGLGARREQSLRYLGYVPESPFGGELIWQEQQCMHANVGSNEAPVYPDALDDKLPLHQALNALTRIHVEVGTLPRGTELELLVRSRLETSAR